MHYLLAILRSGKNYSAFFPDIPGCIATGDTVEETVELATEAAALHMAGQPHAAPRSMEEILADDSLQLPRSGVVFASVRVPALSPA